MSENSDKETMLKAAAGDKAAFAGLFKKYYPGILNFFWRLVWDHAKAQELAQDVFLKLWKKRRSYKGTGKFSTYLFQIAKNHWVNQLRRKKRFQQFLETRTEELKREDWGTVPGPEKEVEKREIRETVRKAIKSLPDNFRVPFILSRYTEFKYKDIAEILGISPRTVEWRIAQAFHLLGEKLAKLKET
jgi:RNA polymerase sigma-70 factor (ECF subfamily)